MDMFWLAGWLGELAISFTTTIIIIMIIASGLAVFSRPLSSTSVIIRPRSSLTQRVGPAPPIFPNLTCMPRPKGSRIASAALAWGPNR